MLVENGNICGVSRVFSNDYEFDFADWPFYWLARGDRAYLAKLELILGKVNLDIPRWRVLMVLHSKSPASVSEIAEHSIVKLSTMTKIIQRMQKDGLVQTAPSTRDGRVTEVTITSKGDEAGKNAWEEANRIMEVAFSGFSKKERLTLTKLLQKLTDNLIE